MSQYFIQKDMELNFKMMYNIFCALSEVVKCSSPVQQILFPKIFRHYKWLKCHYLMVQEESKRGSRGGGGGGGGPPSP